MGAGASATAAKEIQDAAPEDLKAALAKLPADKRATIEEALGQDKPVKAPDAPDSGAKAEEKPVKAEDKPVKAEDAPDSGYAPHLKEAFTLLAEKLTKLFQQAADDMDNDKIQAQLDASQDEFQELLGKSFDHHDTNGTGLLEPKEATVFFKNVIGANCKLSECIIECVVMTAVKAELDRLLKELPDEEDKAEARAEAKLGIQQAMAEHKRETAKKVRNFKKNVAKHCADAFEVVDKNEDGTLQRAEFLEAMRCPSEKYDALMAALGMD